MNLSNKLLVFSFNCKTVNIANKYDFFKPLFCEKFWVDLNYCPRTISFKGRYKSNTKSLKFDDLNVILKWKTIKLEDDSLVITIDKSKASHLPNDILSKLTNHDEMKIYLPYDEVKRIKENKHLMGYLKAIGDENNAEDCTVEAENKFPKLRKSIEAVRLSSSSVTPSTSRNNESAKCKPHYLLRQHSRKRKFFSFLDSDGDDKPKKQLKSECRKKTLVKKPRILKPRNNRKSVCKVVPLVDLTKSPEKLEKKKIILDSETTNVESALHKDCVKSNVEDIRLNEKQCNVILEKISALCYKGGEVYDHFQNESDAEPCQSYRNYKKTSRIKCLPNGSNNGETKIFKCTSKIQNSESNVDNVVPDKINELFMAKMNGKQDNYKIQTVADLEEAALDIENNLGNVNKKLMSRILKGFFGLSNLLDRKETGIFCAVTKWFRLYLRMQTSIDPKNSKLLNEFEKSIPSAISFIIGCLQYKTKDVADYHFKLLEIMDTLLQNCQPNIISQFANFDDGTISCIWKPIGFVGDFNTQLLALKIFVRFLTCLNAEKQEGELKGIKWTNLNLFKDNLNKVIEKTQQIHAFEGACRELLNNFNMNLSNKLLVFSFNCKTVKIANKYEFFKPLFCEKFWVDLNYCPRTISFKGRYKSNTKSLKFDDLNVILKWKTIKLEDDSLVITIDKSKASHLPNDILSKLTNHDEMKMYLPYDEVKRIKENKHLMGYLKAIGDENNAEDCTVEAENKFPKLRKSIEAVRLSSSSVTPSTSRNNESAKCKPHYLLRQHSRKRKFFSFLDSDGDDKPKKQLKSECRKKTLVKKPRILKPRNNRKSVCKVVPLVDLTKSPEKLEKKKIILDSETTNVESALHKDCVKSNVEDIRLNEKQCNVILEKISALCYKGGEVYDHFQNESDAEPCQSYRNYKKTSRIKCLPSGSNNGETKIFKCTSKIQNSESNVDNVVPDKINNVEQTEQISEGKKRKRKITSQDLFDNLIKSDDNFSADDCKRPLLSKYVKKKSNQMVDLTLDQNILSDDVCPADCEEMRLNDYTTKFSTPIYSPNSNPKTPTSTTTMNVSDINYNCTPSVMTSDHFLSKDPRTEGEETAFRIPFGRQELNTNETVEQIKVSDTDCYKNSDFDKPNMEDCVIYQKRVESDVSDSDSDIDSAERCNDSLSLNSLETPLKQSELLTATSNDISPRQLPKTSDDATYRSDKNVVVENVTTTTTTTTGPGCQMTPSIIIMSHTKVNTRETLLISDPSAKLVNRNVSTRKRLYELYNNEDQNKCIQRRISIDQDVQLEIVPFERYKIKPISNFQNKENSSVAEMMFRVNNGKQNGRVGLASKIYGISSFKKTTAKSTSCESNLPLNTQQPLSTAIESKVLNPNNSKILSLDANKTTTSRSAINDVKDEGPLFIANNNFNKTLDAEICKVDVNKFQNGYGPSEITTVSANNEGTNEILCTNCEIHTNNDLLQIVEDTIDDTKKKGGADFENEELFKNELSNLIYEYNDKIHTSMANLCRKCLTTNSFDEMKQKICDITEMILRQSKEQRRELERVQSSMERLMRQMECEYQIYVKRTKEYESFQENAERTLDTLGRLYKETGRMTNEYNVLINRFTAVEKEIRQEMWQNYLKPKKQDILNEIEKLSEI